jgi:hypothetical protein
MSKFKMAMLIHLEGVNEESEEAKIYLDNYLVGQEWVYGPNSTERMYIFEISEQSCQLIYNII